MLLRSRIFLAQAAVLLVLAAVDVYANQHFLFWRYPLIDVPVHFLAGAWVVLAFLWLTACRRIAPPLLAAFLFALLIGGLWELYEYVFHLSYGQYYVFDTSKDLLMDALGGLSAYTLAHRFRIV